jgi:hypothetical protein
MAADLENLPTIGYRLMPFRLRLVIDLRQLDRLLVELANSPLPFEIRQVRINADETQLRHSVGRRGSMYETDGPATTGTAVDISHQTPVDIRGVAYLIDPPDLEKLGAAQDLGGGRPPLSTAPPTAEAAGGSGIGGPNGSPPLPAAPPDDVAPADERRPEDIPAEPPPNGAPPADQADPPTATLPAGAGT